MKPILFLLNDRKKIKTGRTTSLLILACHKKGHPVFVTDVLHLKASSSELFADALLLPADKRVDSPEMLEARMAYAKSEPVDLSQMQAIFVRTTPGREVERAWAHRLSLEVMRLAQDSGVRVLNDPAGLQRASSKLYTVFLPDHLVPKTLVCHSLSDVQTFAKQLDGRFVLKPLVGSEGRDIFFLDSPDAINTRQVVEILGRNGYLLAQEFIPEAAEGDIRVFTLDDSIILGAGRAIGVRRVPAEGELRSNVSLGGTASVVGLTDRQAEICNEVAGFLAQDGIRFAGLDLIGDKIIEVNVFSPSGLQAMDQFMEKDICGRLAETLLESPPTNSGEGTLLSKNNF